MSTGKNAPFSVALATAIANAAVPAALKQGSDPVTFTRAALLEYSLACWASADAAASTQQTGVAGYPGANVLGGREQWAFDTGKLDGINLSADVTRGVPPAVAVALHYLATRRAQRKLRSGSSRGVGAPMVNHEAVTTGPEGGTIAIPGIGPVPIPVPIPMGPAGPVSLPSGIPFPAMPFDVTIEQDALGDIYDDGYPSSWLDSHHRDYGIGYVGDDMGAIPAAVVVLCLGAAAIAAGAWAIESIETEKEVQATKRRDLEISAQVKLATDLCTVNAAAGQPCDVPSVVASMAKDEKRDRWLVPVAVIGAIGVVGVGAAYAHKRGVF